MKNHMKVAFLAALLAALLSLCATASAAPLGRVVAMGDSLASGQWLGPQVPGSIADCGQSTGGYPELAMARVAHGTWKNATCNGTTADNFQYGWTGPSGTAIPPQYNSLNGSEDLVIVGSGSNEAFFGKIAYDCTGYQPAIDAFFHNRDYPQQAPWPIPNHCSDTYLVSGVNQIPNYVAISKSKIASALTRIHQISPNAKILLMGTPRIAEPSGSQCFSSEFWLTATDAPLYATWEEGVRQAMIEDVNAFNGAAGGNYARFVDMQGISGTAHTACETSWSARWMNPHTYQQGLQYPGIALHNTPLGASVTANAIVDAIHSFGFDTGAIPASPMVSISSPASGIVTTSATIAVNYSATDNVGLASCTFASGASIALNPGANTVVVTCLDHAGNAGSDSITVWRDAAPPTIAISSPANGSGTTAPTTQLNYTATDDVGNPSCTPASGSTVALSTGANTLSVSCTDSVGRSASSSVTVYRGTPPVVAIASPANNTNTTASSIAVAYTVNGASAIPAGTACTVGGANSSSTEGNSVALVAGANTITVSCNSLFGSSSSSITVNRGSAPIVGISAPANDSNTTNPSANVSFTVNGGEAIPVGTTCTVGGVATTSTSSNTVTLAPGANTLKVACSNPFGSASASVAVNLGALPTVAVTSPANGLITTSGLVNVAYTVGGSSTIPAGTTCTVNGASSTSTGSNSVSLTSGANTIAVSCTNAFGSAQHSVTVNYGVAPVVAITTPANNSNTTSATTNVAFTVNGASAINPGTTCTVGGAPTASATTNVVSLSAGANSITVACSNSYGDDSKSVTVNRGDAPVVAITAPANNSNTTGATTNVVYSVGGSSTIPAGTTCTVNGTSSTSTGSNSVSLVNGANTIAVSCSNAFGASAPASVTVNRGHVPVVAIASPTDGVKTTFATINVSYTVDSSSSIAIGTTCTVGGAGSTSAGSNSVSLVTGQNTVTVVCSNAFGSGSAAVTVNRGSVPAVVITSPANNTNSATTPVNVTYTVGGGSSIPADTTCTVNGASSTSGSANSVTLTPGANPITVVCTNAFGPGSSAVNVNYGNGPAVVIVAPADGANTTAASVNTTYTVGGANSIPAGTTCTVNGASSTNTAVNSVSLNSGANTITVSCSNAFGSDSKSVTVNRGTAPTVVPTSPANNSNTTASSINVAYTVDGSTTIPAGTTCTVAGGASTSGATNSVNLAFGANSISVTCVSAFGSSTGGPITVNRGSVPTVAITAPADGTNTTASSVNATFAVGGGSSIPAGTTCTVNGASSTNTAVNSVSLNSGANTIAVTCTNAFGASTPTSVTVNRGAVPVVAITSPTADTNTTASSINASYTVGGGSSIPAGTTCTVNGASSTDAAVNSVSLTSGANAIVVACTNAFGPGVAAVVNVNRGAVPAIAIASPADNTNTTASSTNAAFTVGGASSIPAGTSCTVNDTPTSSTTTNAIALNVGANTITVGCSNAFGAGAPASVVVNRGSAPVVTIVAPGGSGLTTAASINVAYTVGGASSIPGGTNCTVAGSPSTSTTANVVSLSGGDNQLTVSCSNPFGTSSAAITVTRGSAPLVAITAPDNNSNTSLAKASMSFTVDGSTTIPLGTTCVVDGASTSTADGIEVALSPGANLITVACANEFGASTESVSVTRVPAPSVTIVSPASGTASDVPSVAVSFLVGGSAAIPAGTVCSVGGVTTGLSSGAIVALAPGVNMIEVRCTDAYGSVGAETLIVNYAEPVDRVDAAAVAITGLTPGQLRPRRSGSVFSRSKQRSAAKFYVTLGSRGLVRLSIERLGRGHSSSRVSNWQTFELPGGRSTIYISGRARGRALTPGRYRVRMIVGNTTSSLVGRSFRVVR